MAGRRLAVVPESPPRALGLIRVSKEREGMVSPDVQRAAITDYAAARGYIVERWIEGLDESGSRARSAWWPRLDQAVAEVEAGAADVLLVWKYSRAARHRLRWAVAIDRVEEAGGRLESATEQFDTTTSSGRLARGMLAELQAFEAERIGEVWREVHARRVATGRPANGKPRYGYRYDQAAKLHRPDPQTGPVLADLYRRYTAGESIYQLVRWLNGHGWRTTIDGRWSDRSLRRVLDSGFASGQFMVDGHLVGGVHEALIDPNAWQAYLDARQARRAVPARSQRSPYVMSGMVRCAKCGRPMVAGQFGDGRAPKYRCRTGKEEGPEGCQGGYVTERFLLDYVHAFLTDLAAGVDGRAARLEPTVATSHRAILEVEAEVLARKIAAADQAIERFAINHAETPLPANIYRTGLEKLQADKADLERSLESARREARRAVEDRPAVARELLHGWDLRPVAVRREILRGLIECVLVTTGRPRARFRIVEPNEVRPRA